MRIGIIGHRGILGSAILAEFANGNEIIGLSRSTGYDLLKNYKDIIDICKECDLVFNNAHVGNMQADVIKSLVNTQVKLVTSGSMAANYSYSDYCKQKRIIEDTYQLHLSKYTNRCLLLKMGYLEGVESDLAKNFKTIPLATIISSIRHWLSNTRITRIEFENVR
jgi:nucleoside-diphosphate-sugar epimerase